jgi:hypothetical protein
MSDEDVIAARFCPGFSIDPTHWRVFIGRNRRLRQEVVVTNFEDPDQNEVLRYTARLSRPEMQRLWALVEGIGFRDFRRRYTHETMCITDCATYWITVRFEGRAKEVEMYDPHRLAEFEKNPAAVGFLELWEAIHQHAPHGKVPIEAGRPKPWWRLW